MLIYVFIHLRIHMCLVLQFLYESKYFKCHLYNLGLKKIKRKSFNEVKVHKNIINSIRRYKDYLKKKGRNYNSKIY